MRSWLWDQNGPLPSKWILSLTDECQAWNWNAIITKDYRGRCLNDTDFTFRIKSFWWSHVCFLFYLYSPRDCLSLHTTLCQRLKGQTSERAAPWLSLASHRKRRHLFVSDRFSPGLRTSVLELSLMGLRNPPHLSYSNTTGTRWVWEDGSLVSTSHIREAGSWLSSPSCTETGFYHETWQGLFKRQKRDSHRCGLRFCFL